MQDDILDTLESATLPVHEFPLVHVLIASAVVVLALLVLYVWRRLRPKPVESLEQAMRRQLQAITTTDPRALHEELARLLIGYAEQRLKLRASRLTSAEILREFARNGVMSARWQASLAGFLRECDRAKFAPQPEEFDRTACVARCRAIFDELAAYAVSSPQLTTWWEWSPDASV